MLLNLLPRLPFCFAGTWFHKQLGGTIVMNERQSIWLLGWTVGGALAMAFVLNAIALAAI